MATYEDLLNQLMTELRSSLRTRATEEQVRDAAATLMDMGEPIDTDVLE